MILSRRISVFVTLSEIFSRLLYVEVGSDSGLEYGPESLFDRWLLHALACFRASLDLWSRLPLDQDDKLLGGQRRLLEPLVRSAEERRGFHHFTAEDRAACNLGRRHGLLLLGAMEICRYQVPRGGGLVHRLICS
jgi:hypothetical protein